MLLCLVQRIERPVCRKFFRSVLERLLHKSFTSAVEGPLWTPTRPRHGPLHPPEAGLPLLRELSIADTVDLAGRRTPLTGSLRIFADSRQTTRSLWPGAGSRCV